MFFNVQIGTIQIIIWPHFKSETNLKAVYAKALSTDVKWRKELIFFLNVFILFNINSYLIYL